ncbi:MAG: putative toxin-antitoxin system toxin component, PIN family [Armatimonadetes bacterium]|nr:putative toxin-antitoxin system toxin component, PIN family [Armatimonadota bacterium]
MKRDRNAVRAVVDANVWVSALINPQGAGAQLMEAARRGQFTVVCSRPVPSELETVLQRPRVARLCGMTRADVAATARYLRNLSYWVTVTGEHDVCRDPQDNKVIETAIRGRAPIIVSKDSDLLDPALREPLAAHGIRVLTDEEFLATLRRQV